MVKSAIKRIRRKSQREAARLQKKADAVKTMEEEEEIHFKRHEDLPDTPRVSRTNSPDQEEGEAKDLTAVLEMVKTVRDRLAALVLDNTNIRAACDDLRRQCHSQGVAFGDLSRLVRQSREDQEESRADTWEETRPHPRIRPELLDGGGNLRGRDIGITWQDGDTFLHGVRVTGQRDDMEVNHRRPATAAPYPPCPEELENARRQPAMSTPYQQSHGHPPSDTSSIQTRRGLTATDSLSVQDGVEQVSSHEREEITETDVSREGQPIVPSSECEDPLHYEDPVMHISGAGHWFLEGWIGDHSVEFLVDSGSSVTAMSDIFYRNLVQAGAPVGALQITTRTLRSANGTGIEVLGCSRCSVSFLGLRTEFPIIVCSLAAGTDAIIGTDVLGSVLPHTLDIKNGLLFARGGASLQLHRKDLALIRSCFYGGPFIHTAIFRGCFALLRPDYWWPRTAI